MRKTWVIAVVTVGLLVSCKDKKLENAYDTQTDVQQDSVEAFVGDTLHLFDEEEPPVAVDELFDDFFYSFMDDARFQGQRITYPLPCKQGDNDEEQLSKDDWTKYNHFENQEVLSVIYEREQDYELSKDTSMQHVGVEWIRLTDGHVERFNFNRVGGKWMLTGIDKNHHDNMPNRDFLNFYAHFMADTAFQRASLAEPLKVVITSEDGEDEPEVEELNADEWTEMLSSIPLPRETMVNVDYGQACISTNRKTLLLQGISNGMQMKFQFYKDSDGWKLKEIEY